MSSTGRDVQLFLDAARQLPDVRTDKVQEIKNKYDSGNYSADPKQLAEKIVSKGDYIDFRG